MNSFQVKLNYEDAQAPTRGSDEAAGYDLYSYESETVAPNQIKLIVNQSAEKITLHCDFIN